MARRRKWQLTTVLLPGKFHGWRSLVGYSPWGHKEADMTEPLHFLSFFSSFWRRKWQPTPVFLPGESCGQRGLVGYNLWGCRESDTTKQLTHTHTVNGNSIHPTAQVKSLIVMILLSHTPILNQMILDAMINTQSMPFSSLLW